MLLIREARIPIAFLPAGLIPPTFDAIEPTLLCDLRIQGDKIASVTASLPGATAAALGLPMIDVAGAVLLPALVDAHTHLDKAHTWFRAPNRSGTFGEALEVLFRDKANWTEADLRRRAEFSLRCAWAHGTSVVRTHLDTWLPHGEVSHVVLAELREAWKGRVEVQTVPLCGGDTYMTAAGEEAADLALRYGASALGGFLQMSPTLPAQVDRLLAIAKERRVGIDLHVDENGNPAAEVLRAVADGVLRNAFPFPVVCGHCCSLAVQAPERQRETIARVKKAGIGIISLPLCNLYLQDRRAPDAFPRTPSWRGLTLVQDLLDAGVPVACASDNVRDAFFAYGDFDMLEVYAASVRLAHLDNRMNDSIKVVSSTAAALVGRPEWGKIEPGSPARLVITAAHSFSELLSRPSLPRRRVDGEQVHTPMAPSYRELE
jgi:cytosine deaminase